MEISIIGPINSLGYGYATLHILDELIKLGSNVSLFPIGQPNCHMRHEDNVKLALKNADKFDISAPCIRIWHQHDMSMFVGKNRHIGFPIFELDTFTDKEKHHLRSCDNIFVCSEWAKTIIGKNLDLQDVHLDDFCKVVPLGVDNSIFKPKLSQRDSTIFLNVGKWEVRKGHDILTKAFNLAFDESDDVELWMMCDNPFLNEEQTRIWINRYKDSKLGHKIRLIPRVETDEEVARIMQQADCGIFPSRAEGWNLEALEMLSCGKQVIATDYSAHTEFLTEENAFLLPINSTEPAFDGIWFHNQGNWAYINEDYKNPNSQIHLLIQHMQYIHRTKQSGGLELNRAGIKTSEKYSWDNTARIILSNL